ncbi:MAG: glycosyltransferase family 4 protein [Acidobacteriia bacterium]|nr:glycosyltransferase family 4 protein [Terriglobia bacterium]
MPYRIAIVTTHPIQYQAPWFRAMAAHPALDLDVFFCHQATPSQQADAGFGVEFDWDVPLLEGYRYRFLNNVARNPSANYFRGLDTPEIGDIVREQRFDAVINCGWHRKSYWQSIRACWKTKTPVMVRSDSTLHTERSALKAAVKLPAYRLFIPRMDACLAVGHWSRQYYLHYGARHDRIFLVPHTIDEPWFHNHAKRLASCRPQLRAAWKLPEDATVFLWAAKFIPKKRPMDLLRALDAAARGGARVHGLMVGDGPLRAECEQIARDRYVPVTFAGFLNQSEMVKAYVAADALVLPSDGGETWGLVVNEAMVCGRACIVSDKVGCGPDLITPETGAVYPLGDVERLAALMSELAADPARVRSMGAAAAQEIAEYSTDVAVRGVLEAVHAVAR